MAIAAIARRWRRAGTAALLVTACTAPAFATPIASPNDPAFGAAPITVDFESTPPGIYPAFSGGLSVPTAAGDVNFTGARLQITGTYAGQYNMTGAQYLSSEGYLFRNLIITFPAPVHAFGFNVGLTSHPWELYAYDAAGNSLEMTTVPATLGSNAGDFVGIASATEIAQAILVVQLPLPPGPLWVVVDNLKFDAGVASLAVAKRGHGDGTVTSAPVGIDCGATCAASFPIGQAVTLTAVPTAGSFFGGWGDACTGIDATAAVAVTTAVQCAATFHLTAESADLGIEAEPITSRPRVAHALRYRVVVENRGPAPAVDATVQIDLTGVPSSDEATITASAGCTVTGAAIRCALGTLRGSRRKSVTVSLVPSRAGTIGLAAQASSSAPDPTPAAVALSTRVR